MGSRLPFLTETQFRHRVLCAAPACSAAASDTLYTHYSELRRWNRRLSLVGPGTGGEVVERHYGESLAALPLIRPTDRSLLDVGSGAGFPGLVLAVVLPHVGVTLVEPRERKWAFLCTAVRRCGLSSRCLNVRVGQPLSKELPREIDVVTCRAVSPSPGLLETLCEGFPGARFLFWCGARLPELPGTCRVEGETALAGSSRRRILEIQIGRRDPTPDS